MPDNVSTKITGAGRDQRISFTVFTDRPLTREQAMSVQTRAGYDPQKHSFLRLTHSGGRSTWSCLGPEACK
jgi:hypothetical protein